MKKRTVFRLLGLAAAGAGAAGGFTALGNYLYDSIMIPRKRDPDLIEDDPVRAQGRLWARQGDGFRPVSLRAVDGLHLWGAYVPGQEDCHRWAICMHGYYDTFESMGAIARYYHDLGWHVLMPDQRGHGKSEGDYIGWGYDERLDLLGWINHVVRRDPQAEIVLHGVSMGAATVLLVTGGVLPRQVKAAISDCAYTSIEAEMRHVMLSDYGKRFRLSGGVPARLLFSSLRHAVQRRAGYDLRKAAPIDAVSLSKTPTLFIHGAEDDFVPAEMMDKLYHAARCPKSFLWVPNANHAAAVGADPRLYWDTVATFLRSWLEPET